MRTSVILVCLLGLFSAAVLSETIFERVVFFTRHGIRLGPLGAVQILMGLNPVQYHPSNYDYNHLTQVGIDAHIDAGTRFAAELGSFLDGKDPGREAFARGTHTQRTIESAWYFLQSLYANANVTFGHGPVLFSDNSFAEDILMNPEGNCPLYTTTPKDFSFVLESAEGLQAWLTLQRILDNVTWTNPGNPAQTVSLTFLFTNVREVNTSDVNNLESLAPIIFIAIADDAVGLVPLGQPGKVSAADIADLNVLAAYLQHGLFANETINEIVSQPLLKEVFDFLQGVTPADSEDADVGHSLRTYVGHATFQKFLNLFQISTLDHPVQWEEAQYMSIYQVRIDGVQYLITKYDNETFDLPGCSVSPCLFTDAVAGLQHVLDIDFADECDITPRCQANYTVTNGPPNWPNGFSATATIIPGSKSTGWSGSWNYPDATQFVTAIWGANLVSQIGQVVNVEHHPDYNFKAEAGVPLTFTLNGNFTVANPQPFEFRFNDRRCNLFNV